MADVVTPEVRSRMMSGIRGKDTKPELVIRRGLHARGYRYRLHARELPGRPDLVLPRYRAVVNVQGCFWHGHEDGCPLFKWPSTRREWWEAKITATRARDAANRAALLAAGWRVLDVWECALKGPGRRPADNVLDEVAAWVAGDERTGEIAFSSLPG